MNGDLRTGDSSHAGAPSSTRPLVLDIASSAQATNAGAHDNQACLVVVNLQGAYYIGWVIFLKE